MIIVQLNGGLGNQLFQYATGYAIASNKNTLLKLDISVTEQDQLRSYRLQYFNISGAIATQTDIDNLFWWKENRLKRKLFNISQHLLPYYLRVTVKEQQKFVYDPNIFRTRKNIKLVGYWQNQTYFRNLRDALVKEFMVAVPLSAETQRLQTIIQNTESVSLHVRRGDYVSNYHTNQVHGVCSIDYYKRAIEAILKKTTKTNFFIFSDDIEWVHQNLCIPAPATYIMHNGLEHDYEDLHLMSLCKHHIIANSTFSWWGAWLCSYRNKIVIGPERWSNHPDWDTYDLLPDAWIKF